MSPIMIFLALLGVFCLVGIVLLLAAKPQAAPEARLETMADPGPHNVPSAEEDEGKKRVAERLVQAGFYRRNSTGHYVVVKCLMAGFPILVGIGMGVVGLVPLKTGVVLGGITGLLATVLPGFWLDARKRKRQTAIRRALPDALDLIVVCVEAGLSVQAGIGRVARELRSAYPLLAVEMIIVEREMQMGQTSGTALRRFADRFDLEELRSLSSVIQQAERFGASIANALRVHAEGLRVKRFHQAEERAQKASVKLLFPTLFCIFPSLYVVLIGPAVFDIWKFLQEFVYNK